MSAVADLVLPAIRWDPAKGYEPARADIDRWLVLGVGGFILFGGEKEATRALLADLRSRSDHPLLIASDLERGAGQQIRGLTSLPPLIALASLGADAVAEAATMTAHEALDIGINWVLGPVCDLDLEPLNPIVQTRSFGADGFDAGNLAAKWITACQAAGALACAKHFPGHGRTTLDSHATLPSVSAGRELERDLLPFRRAVESGVAAVMTAHVAYPAWDSSGAPATHSRALMTDLLRGDLFFRGLIVTDALIMEGAKGGRSEVEGCLRALRAGCDLLLYPHNPDDVVEGIRAAITSDGDLAGHVEEASLRRKQALHAVTTPALLQRLVDAGELTREEAASSHRRSGIVQALGPGYLVPQTKLASYPARGAELCRQSIKPLRGDLPKLVGSVSLEIVDDDVGGPYPLPSRDAFAAELKRRNVGSSGGPRVVLLFADVKSWKGRAGLSVESLTKLKTLVDAKTPVILFGHPRRQLEITGLGPVVCAWSGDEAMQRAAAQRLTGG